MLTCRNCLDGRSYKCEGATCAQWAELHPHTVLIVKRRRAKQAVRRAPKSLSQRRDHAIARMLLDGTLSYLEICKVMHVDLIVVQNVLIKLEALAPFV